MKCSNENMEIIINLVILTIISTAALGLGCFLYKCGCFRFEEWQEEIKIKRFIGNLIPDKEIFNEILKVYKEEISKEYP